MKRVIARTLLPVWLLVFWTAVLSPLWLLGAALWLHQGKSREAAIPILTLLVWSASTLVELGVLVCLVRLTWVTADEMLRNGRGFKRAVRKTLCRLRLSVAAWPIIGRWARPASAQAAIVPRCVIHGQGQPAAARPPLRPGAAPIGPPDCHYLRAAEGWIGLGDYRAAGQELARMTPRFGVHPDVLEVRWELYAKLENWAACFFTATTLTRVAPDRRLGWIRCAQSLHKLGRTGAARDLLLSVVNRFGQDPALPYHLARFSCALGMPDEGRAWLKRALGFAKEKGDVNRIRRRALEDPYLGGIWEEIEEAA